MLLHPRHKSYYIINTSYQYSTNSASVELLVSVFCLQDIYKTLMCTTATTNGSDVPVLYDSYNPDVLILQLMH